ncbi:MAG: alpha/beta fold hydrolase [Gammaproteobacteria bacterium]|nr:alpha/beta fold hydrolase [Gammaproteobacteria bacterium]MBT5204386.1 alpha/beta fold hydrolase [Gammaproteobacteria bacterium]MBT5603447.1 alpha/beta fold hydrolase [Gammaproteobacteria bacterium]MBT6245169.1 alpha/beta fold hydrolase [Gammaproteobacteria bacterium]
MKNYLPLNAPFTLLLLLLALPISLKAEPILSPCNPDENTRLLRIEPDSLCARVPVPESRANPEHRSIDLRVIVMPATGKTIEPDPIVLLAGGPGQAAAEFGPAFISRYPELRKNRDILLIDQRGTGESNSLACQQEFEPLQNFELSGQTATEHYINALKQCLATLDADPTQYTTPIAMDDLEYTRQLLGYGPLNLFGISYGTRAALVYLRRHPSSVRSLILDAVVPMDMLIPEHIATDAESAFATVIADCRAQPACDQAFPDLTSKLEAAVDLLSAKKQKISLVHPTSGKTYQIEVDPLLINRVIRGAMYDRNLRQLLPLAIDEASKGRLQAIVTIGFLLNGANEDGKPVLSIGMQNSVLCSEDMQQVSTQLDSLHFDNILFSMLKAACQFWPSNPVAEGFFKPIVSDTPVLLASGVLDPVTPPKYGEKAKQTLTNAIHIVVPGGAHGTTMLGCMPDLLVEFLNELNPQGLDADCAAEIRSLPFFTSNAGPFQNPAMSDETSSD